jgi:ubiquinone biosynthesis protein
MLTRLRHGDPLRRVRLAMGWFRRFPYAAPGYRMVDVDCGEGEYGFDVLRCPAAEYFAAQGMSELCGEAFCDLDFPLAEEWGVELRRPETLARGGTRCDFRFRRSGGR